MILMPHTAASVDATEVSKFSAMAAEWWDPAGKFAPLHALNPARLSYIKAQACTAFSRDDKTLAPFESLSVLDIGCGGGLLCEPMARLGAVVTGVDASAKTSKPPRPTPPRKVWRSTTGTAPPKPWVKEARNSTLS